MIIKAGLSRLAASRRRARFLACVLAMAGLVASASFIGSIGVLGAAEKQDEAYYLFTSFRKNGEDGLHLAWSADGLKWTALGDDKSYIKPQIGPKPLMRDPFVMQGPDGTFHLVWTTGWGQPPVIGYASSRDLVNWSEQKAISVMADEPAAKNAWAPELFYDAARQQFLIFWSTTIPGRFPETEAAGDKGWNHRIYGCTTKDFQAFSKTRLFFDGGFNVIDATMLKADGKYYLVVKDETLAPVKKNLRIATGATPEGPWANVSEPFTISWVEGPSALRIGEFWYVYFDHYARPQYYGAVRSKDLKAWEDVSQQMSFPPDHRHGAVLRVSKEIIDRLRGTSPASPGQ
jgi:hypothetical protein